MEHQKLNHFKIPSGVFPKIKFFLKNNFFNSEGFDLVIFHTSGNSLLVFFFKLFSKSKIMIEMHGFIKDEIFLQEKVYSPIRYIKIYFHELLAILSFICADYITTCSYSAKIRLLKFNKNVFRIIIAFKWCFFSQTRFYEKIIIYCKTENYKDI
jgi:hypothetical protein